MISAERIAEYQAAGFQVEGSLLGIVVRGRLQDAEFEYRRLSDEGRHTHVVKVQTSASGEFSVVRQNLLTRAGRALGLAESFQTGDAALDARYYVMGTSRDYLAGVFADADNRKNVSAILAAGWAEVTKEGNQLVVEQPGAEYLASAAITSVVERLSCLKLPSHAGQQRSGLTRRQAITILSTFLTLTALPGLAAFNLARPLLDGPTAFIIGVLPIAGTVVLAVLAIVYFGLQDKTMRAVVMPFLVVAPLGMLCVTGALRFANEYLDHRDAETHRVRMLKAYLTNDQPSWCHVVVESWRDRPHEEFDLERSVCSRAVWDQGATWQVSTREGWLGYRWVQSAELAK